MADTIFAEATARGRAGVAILRVSGPSAARCAEVLRARLPEPRCLRLARLQDPADGGTLDHAMVVFFPGPASFTGEDVLELHLHGGPAVVAGVSNVLIGIDGVRAAEAGEFTRRALMNGRMDLAQVEGLGDLLAAETAAQARLAMGLVEGRFSEELRGWTSRLVDVLALVEASIDFADESLPGEILERAVAGIDAVRHEVAAELAGNRIAERLRDGFQVALVGLPNVGKSTLLNCLAGREAAITSEHAGTTRDVIEVHMDLDGLPVTLLDLAGMRDAQDPVERIGVSRSKDRAEGADLRVFLIEAPCDLEAVGVARQEGDIVCHAKVDLVGGDAAGVSGLTGAGVDALVREIGDVLRLGASKVGLSSHARQRRALETLHGALGQAGTRLREGEPGIDLAAEELRAGLRAIDFLVGRVDVETVLDSIFRNFCIGK